MAHFTRAFRHRNYLAQELAGGLPPMDVGPIRIAMAAVERVEISGLVRGMARHPRESRLLEVEDTGTRDLVDERHAITIACVLDRPR